MPRMGRVVPELGDVDVRELIIVPYRLVYQVRESARLIEVHTVVHSRQQFPLDEFLDD
jgi:plasmid stabilization system protein ParE